MVPCHVVLMDRVWVKVVPEVTERVTEKHNTLNRHIDVIENV